MNYWAIAVMITVIGIPTLVVMLISVVIRKLIIDRMPIRLQGVDEFLW